MQPASCTACILHSLQSSGIQSCDLYLQIKSRTDTSNFEEVEEEEEEDYKQYLKGHEHIFDEF